MSVSTIRDVAKRAGVAPITVSRVINRSGNVSSATLARVEKAIEELGYVPNHLARSLRLKRSQTLALVVTDITNPFWTTVVRGVEDAAQDAGFSVILCNTDESESKQEQYLDVMLQKQVDGILLVPATSNGRVVDWIQKQRTPIVILDRAIEDVPVDIVRCNSQGGAYQLVQHLFSLGHRRIGVLTGSRRVSTASDRVAGYVQAMEEAGIEVHEGWVRYGTFSQASGSEMTRQILGVDPRPTALLAGNNFIAIGALRALKDAGLEVPGDMSVVSFDDLTSDLVIDPFLTVADQPAYEMGQQATGLLLARLSGEAPEGPQEILLPIQIKARSSSGPPS